MRSKGKTGKSLFSGIWNSHKTRRKPALLPVPLLRRRLSSHEGFPTPKMALIRGKTALLFWDIHGSKPVWLSGAFSQRKIAANSTYWKAKVRKDGLGMRQGFREGKKGCFGINRNPGQSPKNSPGTYTQISSIWAPIGHSGGSFGLQQAKMST